jgi:quercetin dioxygenase-like cupin family protein
MQVNIIIMRSTMKRLFPIIFLFLCIPTAHSAVDEDGFLRLLPEEVEFQDYREGLTISYITGHPDEEGFYLLRITFAPGSFSIPHHHSTDRHVTVIKGVWHTGTGSDFDRDHTVALPAGSFMLHPAGAVHYDGAKDEEVIVEIKGIGPVISTNIQ